MRKIRLSALCLITVCVLAFAASYHPTLRRLYRVFRPTVTYDTVPPALPELTDPAVLVFSKTHGFRHEDAIPEGAEKLERIAERRGWSTFHTENSAVFDPEILSRFRVVVWLNASGAPVSDSQRTAFRSWLEDGGGFVGVHSAIDDSHASWGWYMKEVIGALFIGHARGLQKATLRLERRDHPATRGLDREWAVVDEWYSFDRNVRDDPGVQVLASLDESTYDTKLRILWRDRDLSMGDHPIIWTRQVGAGRAFLTALGHSADSYRNPNYLSVLEGAIEWSGSLGKAEGQ